MTLLNKVDQFITDTDLIHQVANGDENTVVQTAGGPVRSIAKLLKDNQAALSGLGALKTNLAGPGGAALVGTGDGGNVQAAITNLASSREPVIAAGTSLQYYRGDKTWQVLATAVQTSVLAQYAAITTGAVIAGVDTVVTAIGKLQFQITNIGTAVRSTTLAGLVSAGSNSFVNGADTVLSGFGKLLLLQQIVGTKGFPNGVAGLDSAARITIPPPNGNGSPCYFYVNPTANRVYTLPDKTGTVAMLDDIPAAASSGSVVQLAKTTVTAAVAAVNFPTALALAASGCSNFFIVISALRLSASAALWMRGYFAGSSSSSATAIYLGPVANATAFGSAATQWVMAPALTSGDFIFNIMNAPAPDTTGGTNSSLTGVMSRGIGSTPVFLSGYTNNLNAMTGVSILPASGNIIAGVFTLYGIKD